MAKTKFPGVLYVRMETEGGRTDPFPVADLSLSDVIDDDGESHAYAVYKLTGQGKARKTVSEG